MLLQGTFLHNALQEPRTIVNALAINEDNVMVSGGDNGALWCVLTHVSMVSAARQRSSSCPPWPTAGQERSCLFLSHLLGHIAVSIQLSCMTTLNHTLQDTP